MPFTLSTHSPAPSGGRDDDLNYAFAEKTRMLRFYESALRAVNMERPY
jgi:hypothetical protein